jgi:hypothetical protein
MGNGKFAPRTRFGFIRCMVNEESKVELTVHSLNAAVGSNRSSYTPFLSKLADGRRATPV